jgi:DNA-binding GntR family transcriptional regulator
MLHLIFQIVRDRLIEAPPLRDQVYGRIRAAILSGELPPGARISPAEIARRYTVSTMPVRDALQLLEQEGLVETSARRWTRVTAVDPALVEQLVPIVALLEQYAVAVAPSPSEAQLATLRKVNERFARSVRRGDAARLIAADTEFHAALLGLARNETLERAMRDAGTRLHLLSAQVVRPEFSDESVTDHERVIDRLEAGDRAGATAALAANWTRGLSRALGRETHVPRIVS